MQQQEIQRLDPMDEMLLHHWARFGIFASFKEQLRSTQWVRGKTTELRFLSRKKIKSKAIELH